VSLWKPRELRTVQITAELGEAVLSFFVVLPANARRRSNSARSVQNRRPRFRKFPPRGTVMGGGGGRSVDAMETTAGSPRDTMASR